MPKPTIHCTNCIQNFDAHYPYCPYCGQKAQDDLTLGVLFSNTISNYFSVDARFFKSFLPLMTKPGYLAKRFIEGKRLLYLHPAQMYLFISVVFFFLFSFISRKQVQSIDNVFKMDTNQNNVFRDSINQLRLDTLLIDEIKITAKENQIPLDEINQELKGVDSLLNKPAWNKTSLLGYEFSRTEIDSMIDKGVADSIILQKLGMKAESGYFKKRIFKQVLKFFKTKSGGTILQSFYDSIPIAMFILLPIFAFLLKLFFFRRGRFAHHLVFSFYYFSFLFTVFAILIGATLIWQDFPVWIISTVIFSTFFYLVFGLKRFYGQSFFVSFIKSNVISMLFLSFVIPFATIIMGIMAFLFY